MTRPPKPLILDADDPALAGPAPSPAEAPPPPDAAPRGEATARAVSIAAARRGRGVTGWLLGALGGFLALALGVAAWDFVAELLRRNLVLGGLAAALGAAAVAALLLLALREVAGLARLSRLDSLRAEAGRALAAEDRALARGVLDRLDRLYAGRKTLDWARARVAERRDDHFDADAILALGEREYLLPLDLEARRTAQAAARQVATATALVPLALLDVAAALWINLRMIRRIAEIYGGRAGALGSWRLLKAVATHLVATGLVAAGDDLLGPLVGGGALAKLSRRFGEGLVNGALTARIGVAAMEVCRPLPFTATARPRARNLVAGALAGFAGAGAAQDGPSDASRT